MKTARAVWHRKQLIVLPLVLLGLLILLMAKPGWELLRQNAFYLQAMRQAARSLAGQDVLAFPVLPQEHLCAMRSDSTALAPDLYVLPGVGEGCSALALSRLACLHGKPEEAAGWLRLAEETCPRSSLVAEWAGHLSWAEGDRDRAVAEWLRDERSAVRMVFWARTFPRKGEVELSEYLLDAALPLAVQRMSAVQIATAYENLGLVFRQRQEWDRALSAYQRAVALAPDRSRFWVGLGLAYRSAGELLSSVEALEQALALVPEAEARQRWVTYEQLAITQGDLGQGQAALDSYRRAWCWSRQDLEFDSSGADRLQALKRRLQRVYEFDESMFAVESCP